MEDYGMHFSPDSWSSGSGPEGSLSLEELATWAETAVQKEMGSKTFATSETVSSSVAEQKQDFAVPKSQDGNITATLHHPSTAPQKPKGKAQVVFTEGQLNILVHHFNLKHYYEPGEMKQLAEMTGLTYRQVKTWFQNRRRKFRERSHSQHVNQGFPLHFQGNGQPPLREQYTQHMEINIIRDISNDQNHSPHPVDNFAAGPQLTFPNSPTGNNQYEFNPVASTIVQRNNSGPHNTYGACGDPCQQPMLLQML